MKISLNANIFDKTKIILENVCMCLSNRITVIKKTRMTKRNIFHKSYCLLLSS